MKKYAQRKPYWRVNHRKQPKARTKARTLYRRVLFFRDFNSYPDSMLIPRDYRRDQLHRSENPSFKGQWVIGDEPPFTTVITASAKNASDGSYEGHYFASPEAHTAAIQHMRDYIEQYEDAEWRAELYRIYNIPPQVIE